MNRWEYAKFRDVISSFFNRKRADVRNLKSQTLMKRTRIVLFVNEVKTWGRILRVIGRGRVMKACILVVKIWNQMFAHFFRI